MAEFARLLCEWQRREGRHDLPWQNTRDPYRIWLSEIMLQQTQVATVLGYYGRFLDRFPDLASLAKAPLEAVLQLWSGLGYYSRARNLHRCAQLIVERHGGVFPSSAQALEQLPGIGPSTAAAIAVFAFGERAAILDGNVKRVLCRLHAIEADPNQSAVMRSLWHLAREALPERDLKAYTQGLMDLGATVCLPRRPACDRCPVAVLCPTGRDGSWERVPARRRTRLSPVEERVFVILTVDRHVLVEERPPAGIWGGLWSLPEFEVLEAQALPGLVKERYGLVVTSLQLLPEIRHAFTHFRLLIRPWLARVDQVSPRLSEPLQRAPSVTGPMGPAPMGVGARQQALRWLPLTQAGEAALPQPVKKLLLGLV